VIRLRHAPTAEAIRRMEEEFRDILTEGGLSMSPALPEETEESALADLPRLTLSFNRRNFGRSANSSTP